MTTVVRKMSSRSYIAASERHSSRGRIDLMIVQPKLSKSLVIAFQSRVAMRSWMERAVVVTPSSFLGPEGLVCDPRPNDIRRCLRCYELLGGKEWPPQVRSRRKPAQQPAPNWGNLSGSPLRNSRRSSRQECFETFSKHRFGRGTDSYPCA